MRIPTAFPAILTVGRVGAAAPGNRSPVGVTPRERTAEGEMVAIPGIADLSGRCARS